jgi:Protein of unknown function (DUF1501)
MFRLLGPGARLCDGMIRREMLRVGGVGLLGAGLNVSNLLAAEQAPAPRILNSESGFGQAKSCIVLFLMGGPSQHSTWDPKPDAPAEVRGEFAPIATSAPGVFISELLPRTAQVADKLCILRAVSTDDHAHSSSGYYMMTGRPHVPMNFENANPGAPNDVPCMGGLMGRIGVARGALPASVTIPHRIFNTDGSVWPGQDAGFLGRASDPWLLNAKLTPEGYRIQEIDLPADIDPGRMGRRHELLDQFRHGLDTLASNPAAATMDRRTIQAFDLLASPQARRAFRLDEESESNRLRYGETPFGQSVLLSRRLVESGVRLVQVNWYRSLDEPPANPCWDSHVGEAGRLKDVLVPPTDRALSALIEDLNRRGMLEETLVVCMSEFGRSPRLDGNGGRGHWGSVFSIAMAGGGVKGGQTHGASDRIGAYPREGLVRPEDLSATIFHCLGYSPATEYQDQLGRPHPISRGEVLHAIL